MSIHDMIDIAPTYGNKIQFNFNKNFSAHHFHVLGESAQCRMPKQWERESTSVLHFFYANINYVGVDHKFHNSYMFLSNKYYTSTFVKILS